MATSTYLSVVTSTLPAAAVTSIPLFLPTEIPIGSYGVDLPGGLAVGVSSSARVDYLVSVVAVDHTAVTYELDCQTHAPWVALKPASPFLCPYHGARITNGPATFVSVPFGLVIV